MAIEAKILEKISKDKEKEREECLIVSDFYRFHFVLFVRSQMGLHYSTLQRYTHFPVPRIFLNRSILHFSIFVNFLIACNKL